MLTINAFARDRGWLFEDLKERFEGVALDGVRVVASDEPLPRADAWIALRAIEAGASPDPRHTMAQIGDFYDDGMYLPGGQRAGVREVAAIALCHPAMRELLERSGIDVESKVVLERPLGALRHFQVRSTMPPSFNAGWVGRGADPRKRVSWFEEVLLGRPSDSEPVGAVLIGKDLDPTARRLTAGGIVCSHFPRSEYSIEDYPRLYERMDCLVITSFTEGHPLTLFEALATGIPVIATSVGWAPLLASRAPRYVRIVDSPAGLRSELEDVLESRTELFGERQSIARLVEEWRLEDWLQEVVQTAAGLVSVPEERPQGL